MRLAFEKASQNIGSTNENPSVGCVIVKDGAVISSAVTSIKGRPHAEVKALKKSQNLQGSTMYVTLEPCMMCSGAIYLSKISRVVYALDDKKKGYLRLSKGKTNNLSLIHI